MKNNESLFFYDSKSGNYIPLKVIFVTGRPEKYRIQTVKWLSHVVESLDSFSFEEYAYEPSFLQGWIDEFKDKLFMRPDFLEGCAFGGVIPKTPDHRPSHEVKREIFEREIRDKYKILFVIEDSDDCARMYRDLGLTVLKVME